MKGFFLFFCGLLFAWQAQAAPITVTDITGREVTLAQPAKRIILTQARHMPVLALLHPDPVSLIAGWSDEFKTAFVNEYEQYQKLFPAIRDIPTVGRHTAESFSVEQSLALRPDLVVLTARFAGLLPNQDPNESALIRRFEAAGVPVLIVDFFMDPLQNTVPSLKALGAAIGATERTQAFIDFYQEQMQAVQHRLQDLDEQERPPVFIHAHAGSTDCCNSPGTGTFNDMVRYAGGHNIGVDVLKTPTGKLNYEFINARNPHVYVATGTGAKRREQAGGLLIGTAIEPEQAQKSLQRVIQSNKLQHLRAVQQHNAHGIWHAFNDSPLHMIFIQALASWIHPQRMQGLSAQQTLDYVNQHFLTVPMQGTYIVDLPASGL